jgi:hypothetical protein
MSPFHWSLAIWAAWGLAFLILELLAVSDRVPWNTLSWTSWQIQARGPGFLSLAAAGGLFVLLLHIVFKWPGHKHKLPVEETEGSRLLDGLAPLREEADLVPACRAAGRSCHDHCDCELVPRA